MRNLLLASIFIIGCAGSDLASDIADGGGAVDAKQAADMTPVSVDLAHADLTSSDLNPGACLPQYTHDNGLRKTWVDCIPLGVHTDAQAMRACMASFTSCIYPAAGGGCYTKAIYGHSETSYASFAYAGSFSGKVITSGDCVLAMTTFDWN